MLDFLYPLLKTALILAFVAGVAIISMVIFGRDNEIEEAAEKIFSRETGQNVDFSPGDNAKGGK